MRLTPAVLHLPWGRGTWTTGDAALMYMTASTMVRFGWFTHNPEVGYPFGMDLGNFPFPEIHQWALLRVVTAFTDDPFVALNVFFLLGFLAVGFFSFLLFDATVRHRWLALILTVVLATLPWHYSRFHHTLLADYSPIPISLLLAHGMWSRGWTGSHRRTALAVLGALYIGTSGLYYAFFACLILAPVLLVRLARVRDLRLWWGDALVVLSVPLSLLASSVFHRSFAVQEAVGNSFVERVPSMALGFAGDVPSLLTPWPLYDSDREGAAQFSLFVTVAFVVALTAFFTLTIMSIRGREGPTMAGFKRELRPWFVLLVWALLWFTPGLGWIFAVLVAPEVRSWGRLSLVIAYISCVILGIILREVMRARPRLRWLLPTVAAAVLVGQVMLDHRSVIVPDRSRALAAEGVDYAAKATRLLRPGCPVLQLPAMPFPEEWVGDSKDIGMAAYDHMWVQLYTPELKWSFGTVRGTPGAATMQKRYGKASLVDQLSNAQEDGFCAVHVDDRGVSAAQREQIEARLGEPAFQFGRWSVYPLPVVGG